MPFGQHQDTEFVSWCGPKGAWALGTRLRKTRSGKSRDAVYVNVIEELFLKCFSSTRKQRPLFSNSSVEERLRKAPFLKRN